MALPMQKAAMIVIRVMVISIFLGMFCCSASLRAQSSTSSQIRDARHSALTEERDPIADANALLETKEVSDTLPLRKLIKELKAEKNREGAAEKMVEISEVLNGLRIKWAEALLSSAEKADKPNTLDSDELIECIEQLAPAIGSGLVPLQQIWDMKESREKKWRSVQGTHKERQKEIDSAQAEEKKWIARRDSIHNEIEQAPDTLPGDLLQRAPRDVVKKITAHSAQNKVSALHAQDHLKAILTLLDQCQDITVKALKASPSNLIPLADDDDFADELQEEEAYDAERVAKTYVALSKRVVRDVASELQEEHTAQTLEELQSEYAELVAELYDRADIALHSVGEYRRLCERLQGNRTHYSNHRLLEAERFNLRHHSLQSEHAEFILLRARLKLLLHADLRTGSELDLLNSEITLLEEHKEELSSHEKDALSIIHPSIWMRIKNLFI